jgi:predicted nucleotidyltransferase
MDVYTALLARIARCLNTAQVPYMVIGGQAVLRYGEPRLTKDVDIALGTDLDQLPAILQLVDEIDLFPLVEPETFTRETMVLPCQERQIGVRVDLIFSYSPYEQTALQRVQRITLAGEMVCFVSVEDLMIHKMIAGRSRDIDDVRSLLVRNPQYDRSYVEQWLRAFSGLLERPLWMEFVSLGPAE